MKNIILIGMMGCGKTTCGRLLARRLGRELVDTDALIVEREGRSIPDIFAQSGEDYFRAREVEAAGELARREGLIVACGGGLPLRPAAMDPLRETGTVIFLARDPGETYDAESMAGRPWPRTAGRLFWRAFASGSRCTGRPPITPSPTFPTRRPRCKRFWRCWTYEIPHHQWAQPEPAGPA